MLTETDRDRDKQTEAETEREKQRVRETEREIQRQRKRQREIPFPPFPSHSPNPVPNMSAQRYYHKCIVVSLVSPTSEDIYAPKEEKKKKKKKDVPLAEFMYLVLTGMPSESYRRRPGLCCCTGVTYFERLLTPLCINSSQKKKAYSEPRFPAPSSKEKGCRKPMLG